MSKTLIKNVKVVTPSEVLRDKSVLIENGSIAEIGDFLLADTVIDGQGGYLFAGFIDAHIHGGGGADFMDATYESFEAAVKAHLAFGTTTLLPTAMSAKYEDLMAFLAAYKEFKDKSEFACVTPGVHLEGPYFSSANEKSSGAQPADILRNPEVEEIQKILQFADGDILRWDAAPELEGSELFAKIMVKEGIIPSMAHSFASSEQAQKGIDAGFSHVTHFYNAVTTYHKKGLTVLGGVVEAAYLNDNVSVELIGDGKHIPRDILRLTLKIKGYDKVSVITDAMRLSATDLKEGKLGSLKNGTRVIVDDGVAKLPDLSSFAGSVATMQRCLKVLCNDYGFAPNEASRLLSASPAKLLGIWDKKGSCEKGKDADLVITDQNFNVKTVLLKGKIV